MALDALPAGVHLLPDLIDPRSEAALTEAVDRGPWERLDGQRCQHFGWRVAETGNGAPARPCFIGALPDWVAPLVTRLHVLAPFDYAPDHLVVREVTSEDSSATRPGEGQMVASLVLLGDLSMRLRRRDAPGSWFLTQPRRSLLVLTERFDRNWSRILSPAEPMPAGQRLLTLGFRRSAET